VASEAGRGTTIAYRCETAAGLGALEEDGTLVHEQLIQTECDSDVVVGNSLVDMYAKCGSCDDALKVFNNMPSRDMVT
jgi:pentatricopeptide repeat protein